MPRAWVLLTVMAVALAAAAGFALKHAASLTEAAAGAAWQSQEAASRFSSAGEPTDLDTQMAGLDHRRALLTTAGTWREVGLFLLVWVVVVGGAAYVSHAVQEDHDEDAPPT